MKYEKYITVGHRSDGTRIRKWIKADSAIELNAKISEAKAAVNAEEGIFGTYSARWLNTYKSNREFNTIEYYSTALAKLSVLNGKQMSAITRTDIQDIIQSNWDQPRTCRKLKETLQQIFDAAIADGLLQKNPVKGIHLPPQKQGEIRILSDSELDIVKEAIKALTPQERLFVELAMYLGLRPEEIKALNKDSFHLDEGTVDIFHAVVYDPYYAVIKDTKNLKHRTLPMPDALCASVRAYIAQNEPFYLFVRNSSRLMSKAEFRWFSSRIFKYCIVPALGEQITFYTFRHTRGTQLYYLTQRPNGISTKLAAWYMGHSEQMFLSVYSHIDETKENVDLLRQTVI